MKIKLDFDINSGAASIIYAVGFFGILLMTRWSPSCGQNVIGILGAWTLGFGGYLVKRGHNNKIDLEAHRVGLCQEPPK